MNLLFFTLLVLFWGGSFIAIRFSVEAFPPFAAAAVRTSIATIFFLCVIWIQRLEWRGNWKTAFRVSTIGLLNFTIPWACLFWGEQSVNPALASILNSTVPLFVLLFSWWLLSDEPLTALKLAGVLLGFFGILFIFYPALSQVTLMEESMPGMLAIIVMAVSYALGTIAFKRSVGLVPNRWNLALQGMMGSLSLIFLSWMTESLEWVGGLAQISKASMSLVYLGVFSTAIAWLMFSHLIRNWGALRASAVTYLVPMVAILLDWLYYGEWPAINALIGAALILSGVGLIHFARIQNYQK